MAPTQRALAVPPVLRSRRQLEREGVSFLRPGNQAPADLPITRDGATYGMAQEARWLDDTHFAVGRWDGSLSVFAFAASATSGPLISAAASDPASEGVQMIAVLGPYAFATSAGDTQLTVWRSAPGWTELSATVIAYTDALGAANSGVFLPGPALLVVGHANGFLTVWAAGAPPALELLATVDLRGEHPTNPWGLHNVRGIAALDPGRVVCGSEDGLISVVAVPSGAVLTQTVYNPAAQRGINALALNPAGDLLVANCAVGPDDSNLWSFALDASQAAPAPVPRDHVNLRVNPQAPQVFNFSTVWAGDAFFASTEEGALWMGTVAGGRIAVAGYEQVTTPLGSALAWSRRRLVLAGYDLYEFVTP